MSVPKTPKGKTTKQKILDSSMKLINEKGFENTTLNDMCRASGVATGTFYHYFSSTQDILSEILRIEGEEMLRFYGSLRNNPPVEILEAILVYQMDYFEKKGKEIVSNIYTMEMSARHGSSQLIRVLPLMEIVTEIIRKAQAAKLFRTDLIPGQCAMLLTSLIFAYSFTWLSSEEQRTLKEIALDHLQAEIERMRR